MRSRSRLIPAFVGTLLGLASGLAFLLSTPAPSEIAGPISTKDARQRFEEILEEPEPLRRVAAVAALFAVLEPPAGEAERNVEIDAIREVFERSKIHDGDVEFALFASWWARSEPEQAYRWTQVAPQGRATTVLVALFEEWGRQEPTATVRAVQSLRFSGQRRAALAAALIGADKAGRFDRTLGSSLAGINDRSERRAALQAMLDRRLASEGGERLLAWPDEVSVPVPEVDRDLRTAAAISVSRVDPVRAARALSELSAGEETKDLPKDVIESVAARWVLIEPPATLEWLGSLPASRALAEALLSTFQRWLGRDRSAALAWAADRADDGAGAWFDPIRPLYGLILGYTEPEAGLRVLFELPIGEERARNVQSVFANWRAVAPDAAEAWLQQADLPDFRKEDLRQAPLPARPLRPREHATERSVETR